MQSRNTIELIKYCSVFDYNTLQEKAKRVTDSFLSHCSSDPILTRSNLTHEPGFIQHIFLCIILC